MIQLAQIQTIYFIGIGGIGMSALARYFLHKGVDVHGYDRTATALTHQMEAEGMKIHYTDDPAYIPEEVDLAVYTPAVPADMAELTWFRERGLPLLKRAAVLGIISKGMKNMAVAGTHGKTTTSSMLTHIMQVAGMDCTAFLGGIMNNYGTNYLQGEGEWVVTEADEYDRSFLHLYPDIAIINSVDPDHLDIYGDEKEVIRTYQQFIEQIKPGGTLIIKSGLPLDVATLGNKGIKVMTFGRDAGDYQATGIRVDDGWVRFDIRGKGLEWDSLQLAMPGFHNVENATAAALAAWSAGVGEASVREALHSFTGVERRFEIIYRDDKVVFVNDYAHHPEELKSVIQAARMIYPGKKITGVFQPHLYTRTRDFAPAFASALDGLDEVILLEIYPARERPIPGVDANLLLKYMKNVNKKIVDKKEVVEELKKKPPEVLLTLGAGDIDLLCEPIKVMLNNNK